MFNLGDFVVPLDENEEEEIKFQLKLRGQTPVSYPWKIKSFRSYDLLAFFEHEVLLRKKRFRVQPPLDKPLSDYM